MAVSADGSTALVDCPCGIDANDRTWVDVFTRSGGTWPATATLHPRVADIGIRSVALSSDGNIAVIGASQRGVWVFTRSQTGWSEGVPLTPSDAEYQTHYGWSVAISGDGNTILFGSPWETVWAPPGASWGVEYGAAWMFVRSGDSWLQQGGRLFPNDPGRDRLSVVAQTGPQFGSSVALSYDGNTALIGGLNDWDGTTWGAAWVFIRSDSQWTQAGPRLHADDAGGQFGSSVDLSSDGATAVVGGANHGVNAAGLNQTGAAWVFARSQQGWSQQGPILTGDGESANGQFGYASSISGDGTTVIVGAPNDGEGSPRGAVWQFKRFGSDWLSGGGKLAGNSSDAAFGTSLALSRDGTIALIGEPTTGHIGDAFVFALGVLPGPPTSVSAIPQINAATVGFQPPLGDGGLPILSYTATASPGGAQAVGSTSPITIGGLASGTAYTFTVTATNAAGTGPRSTASGSVVPYAPTIPPPPTTTAATTTTATTTTTTTSTANSKPPPPVRCIVPNVKRRLLGAARKAITRAHCSTGSVKRAYSTSVRTGYVISQSPAPARKLAKSSQVNLVISRGKHRTHR